MSLVSRTPCRLLPSRGAMPSSVPMSLTDRWVLFQSGDLLPAPRGHFPLQLLCLQLSAQRREVARCPGAARTPQGPPVTLHKPPAAGSTEMKHLVYNSFCPEKPLVGKHLWQGLAVWC